MENIRRASISTSKHNGSLVLSPSKSLSPTNAYYKNESRNFLTVLKPIAQISTKVGKANTRCCSTQVGASWDLSKQTRRISVDTREHNNDGFNAGKASRQSFRRNSEVQIRSKSVQSVVDIPEDKEDDIDDITESTFSLFDKDGDGLLSVEELFIILHNLGNSVTVSELSELIRDIGSGENGISLQDFKLLLSSPFQDLLPRYETKTEVPKRTGNSKRNRGDRNQTKDQGGQSYLKQSNSEKKGWISKLWSQIRHKNSSPDPKRNQRRRNQWENRYNQGELLEVFNVFDTDGDGLVSSGEIRSVIDKLGIHIAFSQSEIDGLIDSVDKDFDNCITYEEFCSLLVW